MKNYKIYLPVLIAIAVAGGFLLGININLGTSGSDRNHSNLIINTKGGGYQFNILNEILGYVDREYVDSVKKQELIDKTAQYMLQELDPHSYYISASELQEMNEPLEGNFEGIGVQFNIQKDTIVIVTPLQGGPSEKVGIKAGDRIVEVEGETVAGTGITNRDVLNLLKGDKGTKVKVKIKRGAEFHDFTITRDEIPIHSVDVSYMINDKTGYIKVLRFAKTTYDEFIQGVEELKKKGMENLIIDLRGNGGGFLDAAVKISDELLSEGEMIVYTEGRARPREEYKAKSKALLKEQNIAVLIDESSASASEILSGAVQDNDRGIVIGRRSFGKGLVQEQNTWPDGSATRLTVARYYTPTGRCIQRPYDGTVEDYHEAVAERFRREMMHPDSIDFPDSLKYTTPGGKTVYGGGGIFPDIYVPFDTSRTTDYFTRLVYGGILYQWAFDYSDEHRDRLKKQYSISRFKDEFTLNKQLIDEFTEYAESEGVAFNEADYQVSKDRIKFRLKSYIARNVWNSEGYYPVRNEEDEVIKRAIEALESGKLLQALREN